MTDYAALAKAETDPVRRAHFLRMAAGPEALKKLTEKDTRRIDERNAMIAEMVKIGEANKRAAIAGNTKPDIAEMTDDQIRDNITSITGKAPHWKAGREKLIEMYNEALAQ